MPLKAKIQESLIGMLEKRYTGIREIVALLDKVRERVEKQRIAGMHQEQGSSDVKDKQGGSNGNMVATTEDGSSEQVDKSSCDIFKPEDGKWRPVLGTL